MSDVYLDISLLYNDAKVAAKLCVGGAIKYELHGNVGVTKQWAGKHVTPLICQFMTREIGETLALPLLWAAFDPDFHVVLPAALRIRITEAFDAAGGRADPGINPVKRVLLSIAGTEVELLSLIHI